jgi:hypothetical protein
MRLSHARTPPTRNQRCLCSARQRGRRRKRCGEKSKSGPLAAFGDEAISAPYPDGKGGNIALRVGSGAVTIAASVSKDALSLFGASALAITPYLIKKDSSSSLIGYSNAYINGGPGIVLLTPDGSVRQVADSIAFPNGMVVTPDNDVDHRRVPRHKAHGFRYSRRWKLSKQRVLADLDTASPTASASMLITPSGTPTFPTNAACAFAKVVKCYR